MQEKAKQVNIQLTVPKGRIETNRPWIRKHINKLSKDSAINKKN